jgi:uncharacterized protein YcnI
MHLRAMALGTVAALIGLLVMAAPAFAHVTVSAQGATRGGSDALITFRVPTESSKASTTGLQVHLPADTAPIADVLVQAQPGWTHPQKSITLAKALKTDDGEVTEAVSEVDWTATPGNGIKPGEFGAFVVIAGQLPDAPQITFKVIQTYSDGSQVAWIEVPAPGSIAEPDHPAPTLNLAAASGSSSASPGVTATVAPASSGSKSSGQNGAVIVAVVALVVAVAAALLGGYAFLATRKRQAGE